MQPRIIEIRKNILDENDRQAAKLREQFKRNNVFAINVVSSPGAGKTSLLTELMKKLISQGKKVGALVGDLETDNDARRLKASGAQVKQIMTHGNCHLEAEMIAEHLSGFDLAKLDYFFIENVGNLVCPANYDLGEQLRIVMFAVTEGEDKPAKYPVMYRSADLCVISKFDLAEAAEFDYEKAKDEIKAINPKLEIITSSAKSGYGMDRLVDYIYSLK